LCLLATWKLRGSKEEEEDDGARMH
jgi:hypothetical protein